MAESLSLYQRVAGYLDRHDAALRNALHRTRCLLDAPPQEDDHALLLAHQAEDAQLWESLAHEQRALLGEWEHSEEPCAEERAAIRARAQEIADRGLELSQLYKQLGHRFAQQAAAIVQAQQMLQRGRSMLTGYRAGGPDASAGSHVDRKG